MNVFVCHPLSLLNVDRPVDCRPPPLQGVACRPTQGWDRIVTVVRKSDTLQVGFLCFFSFFYPSSFLGFFFSLDLVKRPRFRPANPKRTSRRCPKSHLGDEHCLTNRLCVRFFSIRERHRRCRSPFPTLARCRPMNLIGGSGEVGLIECQTRRFFFLQGTGRMGCP